jgi:hypothetical protein
VSSGQTTLSANHRNSDAKTTLWISRVERVARVKARRPRVCCVKTPLLAAFTIGEIVKAIGNICHYEFGLVGYEVDAPQSCDEDSMIDSCTVLLYDRACLQQTEAAWRLAIVNVAEMPKTICLHPQQHLRQVVREDNYSCIGTDTDHTSSSRIITSCVPTK